MTDNGSCEQRIIKLVMQHVNRFMREFIPEAQRYCITVDGHKSHNGVDWLEFCEEVGCEVVQLPSDTSHFMQACDCKVNKSHKSKTPAARDMLCAHTTLDLSSVIASLI